MIRLACLVSMLSVAAITAAAQNMAEVSLAAATGSVAGAAGKPISDSLDKIFGKVNAQTKSSATSQPQKNASGTREASAGKDGVGAPATATARASSGSSSHSRNRGRQSRARLHYAAPPPVSAPATVAAAAPPPRPLPTLEQIAAVATGTGRSDVLTRLGTPVARLSIPESGQLLEVYQYVDRGGNLGSVRLRDGLVSEVRIDHQIN
jgi:hypothetical protein